MKHIAVIKKPILRASSRAADSDRARGVACEIISFPNSQSPKGRIEKRSQETKGAIQVGLNSAVKARLEQFQGDRKDLLSLYRELRELWGNDVFYGTQSCHENMKSRCKKGYASLDPAFEALPGFLLHMGPRPSPEFSIDRENNDEGYSPTNCRWADKVTQTRNRSNSITLTIGNETKTVKEWAKQVGQLESVLYRRRAQGLSDYQVVYGKRPVILPSSKFWPPHSWDELEACVDACARWSNEHRRALRAEIKSNMDWIDREAEFFCIPAPFRETARTDLLDIEKKWSDVYQRYAKLLRVVARIPVNRYE
ncbi:hypothetical protein SAMN05216344_11415 [Polaromonas sp. OV174]|uniref:hypothetical protein n=1 Tax=Polaromonas sp. OV174 TaxID=1855300 RepID=UPI0008EE3E57|nr:hypothetical protein [Polaromonas sp. OV174]SFC32507.1 hypothetical protein SAMN05216344_11415 [Polaromonas sp. OV174]